MIKLVVFDFDGTIADTRKMVKKAVRESIEKYGYKASRKIILGNTPLRITLKRVIPTIKKKTTTLIYSDFIERQKRYIGGIKLARGINALKKIAQKKIILSNNSSSFIKEFLRKRKIRFFEHVFENEKFLTKSNALKKIFKRFRMRNKETIFIGDRYSDVVAGKKAGCISVAVSNKISWSSKKELLREKPDFLISDLGDLPRIIRENNKVFKAK